MAVLHLITTPFPSVWHTLSDAPANLDKKAVVDVAVVVGCFVAEYLGLSGKKGKVRRWRKSKRRILV